MIVKKGNKSKLYLDLVEECKILPQQEDEFTCAEFAKDTNRTPRAARALLEKAFEEGRVGKRQAPVGGHLVNLWYFKENAQDQEA